VILPERVLEALGRAPAGELVAVVATTDPDGRPHTAPFGSLRAHSSAALRFGCDRGHATYENLVRDGAVTVCIVLPPDVAVSITGRATVLRQAMATLESDAVIEIAIEDVKDDMLPRSSIATGVTYAVDDEVARFIEQYVAEVVEA
jgi:hypothetical protein